MCVCFSYSGPRVDPIQWPFSQSLRYVTAPVNIAETFWKNKFGFHETTVNSARVYVTEKLRKTCVYFTDGYDSVNLPEMGTCFNIILSFYS